MSFIHVSKNNEKIAEGIVYISTPKGKAPRFDMHKNWIRMSVLKTKIDEFFNGTEPILFDIEHDGSQLYFFPVLDNFMCREDRVYHSRQIQEGDYIMSIRVTDPAVWQKIKRGSLNGFSLEFSAVEQADSGEFVITKIKRISIVSNPAAEDLQ